MEQRLKINRIAVPEGNATSRVHLRKRTSHRGLAHLGLSGSMRRRLEGVVKGKEGRRGEDIESERYIRFQPRKGLERVSDIYSYVQNRILLDRTPGTRRVTALSPRAMRHSIPCLASSVFDLILTW